MFALFGGAALIGGWIFPNNDLTPAFISSVYPAHIWVQFVAWLTVRLLGSLAVVGFALVAVWGRRRGSRFGGGMLVGVGLSLSVCVLVSMLNVHLSPDSVPGPAAVLRFVGVTLLITAGGIAGTLPDNMEFSSRGRTWTGLAGVLALVGATVFALVSIIQVPSGGRVGWMFALQYTPMVVSALWALLWTERDPAFAAGLLVATGVGAILASHVELIGFYFGDYLQGIAGALALVGGILLVLHARTNPPGPGSFEVDQGARRSAVQPWPERS